MAKWLNICFISGVFRRAALLAVAALLACACERASDEPPARPAVARETEPRPPLVPPAPPTPSCEERIRGTLSEPALPGTPELDAARADLFANVKAEPVIFVRPPGPDPEATAKARAHAALLRTTRAPWGVLQRMLSELSTDRVLARQALLREGYLYADEPRLALALYAHVSTHHLFDEPRIWIQRGERKRWAIRNKDRYVWEDGDESAGPVRLLMFDRVGVTEPSEELHRDFRSLRERLYFERVALRHLGARAIVANLRYGTLWIPTLLRSEGARLDLECEMVPERSVAELGVFRDKAARRQRALHGLRRAMLAQIQEGLVFDEPKTEIGQQDGHLRMAWEAAYKAGRRDFKFNDDEYRVFGKGGRPMPPQVCVDFLIDTLERASGTWWYPRGETPGRMAGKLQLETRERRELRSTRRFIEYAREKSDWFEVHDPGRREKVEIGRLQRLTRVLSRHADDYAPGDMVVIHGWTPWDELERHYHTFFIYESDPVTGFPLAVVGNAGRPSMRVLRTEANRTPKRNIVARVRPRLEWLESIVVPPESAETPAPAPLVPETSGA